MKIVTGYTSENHITSADDQALNTGIFGSGSYVLNVGECFEATLVSANEIQIADGEGILQGVHYRIEEGTYDSLTIDNGIQGENRIDLIVVRYEYDASTSIESCSLVLYKGESTSGTPAMPSYTGGSIRAGSTVVEYPLYKITLSGITIESVERLFAVAKSITELEGDIRSLNSNFDNYVPTNAAGTQIPSSADLNNYTSGYYACATNTIATSLSNCPTNVAFIMIVLNRASGRPIQIILDNNAALYVRAKQTASTWTSWSTK